MLKLSSIFVLFFITLGPIKTIALASESPATPPEDAPPATP